MLNVPHIEAVEEVAGGSVVDLAGITRLGRRQFVSGERIDYRRPMGERLIQRLTGTTPAYRNN